MRKLLRELYSGPYQLVLVISFSFVAALAIIVGSWSISRVISDYLTDAMDERVARDMHLALSHYEFMLREIEGATLRISQYPQVSIELEYLPEEAALANIDEQISTNLDGLIFGGNRFIAIINQDGDLVTGRLLTIDGQVVKITPSKGWKEIEILQEVLSSGEHISSTEIIPGEYLEKVGLATQARIEILETPRAAPELYDNREGTAGLVLMSVSPIMGKDERVLGAVVGMHLFNKDFTLVDMIKTAGGIDTVTIFLGDLRVSTNVMTPQGERAIGTRIAQEVSDVVLKEGIEYVGPAFVVSENYITRYDPLKNYAGEEIGILYVGARQASFYRLVNSFNHRIVLVSLAMIVFTFILATPVSRTITRPLEQIRDLVVASQRVANGDMSVRVSSYAGGEVGNLIKDFNSMLDTLQTTQDQLVQSEKLASLGQLAAGVAHELNNPLGTILLYSDILLKDTRPDSPIRADLEVIVEETKRCKSIIGSLLEFARQNQVIVKPTVLNELILSVLEVERKRYNDKRVKIEHDLDAELPMIQADHSQIIQVLINLIENSVDAMPSGGIVLVRTRKGPVGMVTIEIIDNGMGIPPDVVKKIFTPFFTTKPVGKGTGLGLSLVYGIIKMHRGQISVRSKVNEGTTFIVQLPIRLLAMNSIND